MTATWDDSAQGFVLGHGTLYNPREERINSRYRFVGLADDELGDEDGWLDIMPCQELASFLGDNPWLETQGPGRLVFIPDKPNTRPNSFARAIATDDTQELPM